MAKQIAVGVLAHVDAGKTTLTESLLLMSGAIRTAGRVDKRDSFLDTEPEERRRGITILAKNAVFDYKNTHFTLIDTPGHVDFTGETERALSVLDVCVLVVSAPESVQAHTLTLWKMLESYRVPTFIFVNKMDMPGADSVSVLNDIRARLSPLAQECGSTGFADLAAESDDAALAAYLETGQLDNSVVSAAIASRCLFPVCFGSALRHEGTASLLDTLDLYALPGPVSPDLALKAYKIQRDAKGERLTFIKLTGGTLRARDSLKTPLGDEKITAIRLYSGEKYTQADCVSAPCVCTLCGIKGLSSGCTLGEGTAAAPLTQPLFEWRVKLEEGSDPHEALTKFRILEEEDPLLGVKWNERSARITVQVMGDVALEVLKTTLFQRFGLNVGFEEGSIIYRETVASSVDGAGHYEPLRHYAEVHLRLEPLPHGSGIELDSEVSTDDLALSWQRLIFTHLTERRFAGVLTGSPLTDVRFVLTAGRAHLKHTEGGDFRQATYRAVRQALMKAENVLLEPYTRMTITLPQEYSGRAMSDISRMGQTFQSETNPAGESVISASLPVRLAHSYPREVSIYSRGLGRVSETFAGYLPSPDQAALVTESGYDAEKDTENPADSVFCSHGAGVIVNWREADRHMHLQPNIRRAAGRSESPAPSLQGADLDEQLRLIFERTYGKIAPRALEKPRSAPPPETQVISIPKKPEYLLVDGYNIIFAWDELRELAACDVEIARSVLTQMLDNFASHRGVRLILVFDAYKVKGNPGKYEHYSNIDIVYTKEAQTADSYIEKMAHDLSRDYRVRVATGDGLEQLIILGAGALRMSARELKNEIAASGEEIRALIQKLSQGRTQTSVKTALADAYRGKQAK
ncbi:MAG: TetM/TetW/TetO/TetS family tetracycline resistance ribosomal protection protein [Clostridiales bacterium]|nr:TetM/TetW/TetO/TetS family tetracycline resistance ribosomal protection protein [Clostridiales bacterium]